MNISEILNDLARTVLDSKAIERLKSVYDTQDKRIDQLQASNSEHVEQRKLLSEKVARLEKENKTLQAEVEGLRTKVVAVTPPDSYKPSKVAFGILVLYRQKGANTLWSGELRSMCDSDLEYESAMHELQEAKFLKWRTASERRGMEYQLTQAGRKYVLSIEVEDD